MHRVFVCLDVYVYTEVCACLCMHMLSTRLHISYTMCACILDMDAHVIHYVCTRDRPCVYATSTRVHAHTHAHTCTRIGTRIAQKTGRTCKYCTTNLPKSLRSTMSNFFFLFSFVAVRVRYLTLDMTAADEATPKCVKCVKCVECVFYMSFVFLSLHNRV